MIENDASSETKGKLLLQALADSRLDVPHPTDWPALIQPLLRSAGVKSWSTFAKTASSCHITADNGTIVLRPYRRQGRQGAFTQIPDYAISLVQPSQATLGEALDACFKIAAAARDPPE